MPLDNPISGGNWITPTLGSVWAPYGAPFDVPSYRKDSMGIVTLRGGVSWVVGANNVIFTLPTGFRPTALKRFVVNAADSTQALGISMIEVRVSGQVWWGIYGSFHFIALDQVSFTTY